MRPKEELQLANTRLKRVVKKKQEEITRLRLRVKQLEDLNNAARTEAREIKLEKSRKRFWRDMLGIKRD